MKVQMEQALPDRKGQNNPMYGQKHSEETKRKMSIAAKARKSPDTNIHEPISMDEFLSNHPIEEQITHIVRQEIFRILFEA